MPQVSEYVSQLKRLYPNIKVDDALNSQLSDASAKGTSIKDVLSGANALSEVQQGNTDYANTQAAAAYDPAYNNQVDSLGNEKNVATTSAQNSISDINNTYDSAAKNDAFSKLGGYSTVHSDYTTNQKNKAITGVNTDLSNKLSYIAQQITTAGVNRDTQKTGLQQSIVNQLSDQGNTGYNTYLSNDRADQQLGLSKDQFAADQKQQAFSNDLALQQLALSKQNASRAAAGSTYDIGSAITAALGGKQTSSGANSAQSNTPKLTKDQAVSGLKEDFASGNLSNDQDFIQKLVSEVGLSTAEAQQLYYQTRKPYELAGGPSATIGPVNSGKVPGSTAKTDSSGFVLYPDGTRVLNDPNNPKKHGA